MNGVRACFGRQVAVSSHGATGYRISLLVLLALALYILAACSSEQSNPAVTQVLKEFKELERSGNPSTFQRWREIDVKSTPADFQISWRDLLDASTYLRSGSDPYGNYFFAAFSKMEQVAAKYDPETRRRLELHARGRLELENHLRQETKP